MRNLVDSLNTKQKTFIILGFIILLASPLPIIGKFLVTVCFVIYMHMKNRFLEVYPNGYNKDINNIILSPILHLIVSYFLYEMATEAITLANKIDSLHNISTYSPYLGEFGQIVDIANQYGFLPEIERSEKTLEYIHSAILLYKFSQIGIIVNIFLVMIEFYGLYRWGKFSKILMYILYISISAVFVIWCIFLGIYIYRYSMTLTGIFVDSTDSYFGVFLPLFALFFWGLCFKSFRNSINNLLTD